MTEEVAEKAVVKEEVAFGVVRSDKFDVSNWNPKTEIGRKVKAGEIKNMDEILDKGSRILEAQIVDLLVPDLETDLLGIGQSKGKFGGGKRSIWKSTQKKTSEGNRPQFAAMVVVGNKNGYVGLGYGKAKETLPAREKAIRDAKLNLIKIRRGCGSWDCSCGEPHSIPYAVRGRCGSVRVELMPAPKGVGIYTEKEAGKIFRLAGIKDLRANAFGQTRTKLNMMKSFFEALKQLVSVRVPENFSKKSGMVEGKL